MCSWIVSEVISYYIRHKTNVYCCLLDLKKAFDKVKFSVLFSKLCKRGCHLFLFGYLFLCIVTSHVKFDGISPFQKVFQ